MPLARRRVLALAALLPAVACAHGDHKTHTPPKDETPKSVKITLPDAPLVDQDGRKVRLRSDVMAGRVVVVDFIYTTCTTICPIFTATMASVQETLGRRRRPRRAADHGDRRPAARHAAPAEGVRRQAPRAASTGWSFLTGSKADVDARQQGVRHVHAEHRRPPADGAGRRHGVGPVDPLLRFSRRRRPRDARAAVAGGAQGWFMRRAVRAQTLAAVGLLLAVVADQRGPHARAAPGRAPVPRRSERAAANRSARWSACRRRRSPATPAACMRLPCPEAGAAAAAADAAPDLRWSALIKAAAGRGGAKPYTEQSFGARGQRRATRRPAARSARRCRATRCHAARSPRSSPS